MTQNEWLLNERREEYLKIGDILDRFKRIDGLYNNTPWTLEYPNLADTYYQLSLEEMKHVTMLHDQVVKIIEEIKRTREVPEGMQTLYDYLHERQIKWAAKIKAKQEAYK